MKNSVLNKTVSIFENYDTPSEPKTVNLLNWIISRKHEATQKQIITLTDKKERDKLKSTLPAITPSGIFTYRAEKNLLEHSGLIQFDIDLNKNNLNITNWNELKKHIQNIPNVAYMGFSVSGKGYWGLIPIEYPQHHKEHFKAIRKAFAAFGVDLDSAPSNIASLRGYSYDSEAYINHNAIVFKGRIKEQHTPQPRPHQQNKEIPKLLDWLIKEMRAVPLGERHLHRLKYGKLLGGYISGGLLQFDAENVFIDSYLSDYGNAAQDKEIKAIKAGVQNGKQFPIYELESNVTATWKPSVLQTAPAPQPEAKAKKVNELVLPLENTEIVNKQPEPLKQPVKQKPKEPEFNADFDLSIPIDESLTPYLAPRTTLSFYEMLERDQKKASRPL